MRSRRSGRVYLLEVVFALLIIAMLFSVLIPSIGSRERPGRSICQNNLRQCSMALLQVEQTRRQFPGYANVLGGKRASWVVMILPQLERMDLYQNWKDENFPPQFHTRGFAGVEPRLYCPLDILVCPSAPNSTLADPLSYVVNSGSARGANDFRPPLAPQPAWVEDLASGVFFNRARADHHTAIPQPSAIPPAVEFSPDSGPIMTLDYISQHDGSTYTILLSENLQAGGWACDPANPGYPMQSEFQMRAATSMVWYVTGQVDNQLPVSKPVAQQKGFDPSLLGINARSDLKRPLPNRYLSNPTSNFGGLAAARPSANHSGGVNVAFCGGNMSYLSEEIDYRVLTQLMTPNGLDVVVDVDDAGQPIRATAPAGTSKRVTTPWIYALDEAEF